MGVALPWASVCAETAAGHAAVRLADALRDHGFRPQVEDGHKRGPVVVLLDEADARRLTDLLRGVK